MGVPKVLYLAPILAAGLFAPGLTSASSLPQNQHAVGMVQENFDRSTITLRAGERLELANNSNFLHVLILGADGRFAREPGAPAFGDSQGLLPMPRGRVYRTPPWTTPGIYHVTCTLHTGMNLTVVVTGPPRSPGG